MSSDSSSPPKHICSEVGIGRLSQQILKMVQSDTAIFAEERAEVQQRITALEDQIKAVEAKIAKMTTTQNLHTADLESKGTQIAKLEEKQKTLAEKVDKNAENAAEQKGALLAEVLKLSKEQEAGRAQADEQAALITSMQHELEKAKEERKRLTAIVEKQQEQSQEIAQKQAELEQTQETENRVNTENWIKQHDANVKNKDAWAGARQDLEDYKAENAQAWALQLRMNNRQDHCNEHTEDRLKWMAANFQGRRTAPAPLDSE